MSLNSKLVVYIVTLLVAFIFVIINAIYTYYFLLAILIGAVIFDLWSPRRSEDLWSNCGYIALFLIQGIVLYLYRDYYFFRLFFYYFILPVIFPFAYFVFSQRRDFMLKAINILYLLAMIMVSILCPLVLYQSDWNHFGGESLLLKSGIMINYIYCLSMLIQGCILWIIKKKKSQTYS